uniref:Ankyrin repeat domain-containing protein 16 n=1 Tax=Timema shepardi TaxID=629360 RepID=A0A7R9B0K6_TIMSH|nr:unnamed protein product [Timema shepardi]
MASLVLTDNSQLTSDSQHLGDTALHIASRQGNLCIVKFLIEEWTAKNCVEVCNFDSKTALHEAAQFSQPHVVQYLIKQGAEVNALKRADWTPLMLACTKVGPDALEIVNILLSNGAKPKLHNKDGWTALHIASREGDVNIVSAVLSADCSLIKLKSHNGRTPLHTAALHGQDSVVALLLKHIKDSVDISDSCGLSPLLEAVRSGNINLVQHFINAGASLNHVDALGLSSVHLAAQTGSLSTFMLHPRCWIMDAPHYSHIALMLAMEHLPCNCSRSCNMLE